MRTLDDHVVENDSVNHQLAIEVMDEAGQGGAHHVYKLGWKAAAGDGANLVTFQNGPIKEVGVNGVTQEALLTIVIDRLRGFQSGPYACRDNAVALTHIEEALMWLQRRTRERIKRNVEGTLAK